MRPQDIFEICLQRVREYQAVASGLGAIRPDASAHGGPAKVGNIGAEYCADFEVCGRRALERWPPRFELFQVYYIRGVPYRATLKQLNIGSSTFDYWSQEIKLRVGKELAKTDLFPPRRYKERIHSDAI